MRFVNVADTKEFWRRHPDLNRGITVLQTVALPLGHGASTTKAVAKDTQIRLARVVAEFGPGFELDPQRGSLEAGHCPAPQSPFVVRFRPVC